MDKRLRTAFIVAADAVAPRGVFKKTGGSLSDFLDSQREENNPRFVAAEIFLYFCIDDGQFNGFLPGVRLALGFLDKVMDGPDNQHQRSQCLKDRKGVLATGDSQQILAWIGANYR